MKQCNFAERVKHFNFVFFAMYSIYNLFSFNPDSLKKKLVKYKPK